MSQDHPSSSPPAFSPDWLKERIESLAPNRAESRVGRERLYALLQEHDQDVYSLVLAGIYFALLGELSRRKTETDLPLYWQERKRIEKQLEKIVEHDLVRVGPDIESIVFYDPHEVICPHRRRRKRCVTIREKVETFQQVQRLLAHKAVLRLRADNPLRKALQARIVSLRHEIKVLAPAIDPATADPSRFCAPDVREPVDSRSRAEGAGPSWRPRGSPGAPPKRLHNSLLENVGESLHNAGVPRRRACELLAAILVYCFDAAGPLAGDRAADAEMNLAGTLERQWRILRAKSSLRARTTRPT